jgi:HEAT repeat protein
MMQPMSTEAKVPPDMLERLKDLAEHVRIGALVELLALATEALPDPQAVSPCLDDSSQSLRRLAVEVLVRYGAGAVSALNRGLDADQPLPIRVAAANALARLGPDAVPAIDSLCGSVHHEDPMLRWHAGFALSKIGSPAIPALRPLLQSTALQVVATALDALERIGPEAKEAQEDIQQLALGTSSPQLQLACATALVSITGDAASGKPVMANALTQGDVDLRKSCIQRLGDLGPGAHDYGEELLQGAEDPSAEVRAVSALALAKVVGDPAIAVLPLTKMLDDSDPEVRANAAIALTRYGPAATPALPRLQALQQEKVERVAAVAAAAISKIQE